MPRRVVVALLRKQHCCFLAALRADFNIRLPSMMISLSTRESFDLRRLVLFQARRLRRI